MPTFWAIALAFSLFSVYIESGNLQKTQVGDQAKDLVAAASTTKNETKKEDKLTKILPLVTFDCTGRIEGYYADVQFDCEAFHYCKSSGERFTFVCPPKSRFNQKHMVCDYDRYGLKLCYTAEKYFKLNENLYPKTEYEKSNTNASTTTTIKPKEKIKLPIVKNKISSSKDIKYVKPETNKPKLEKTFIVTEYYENEDLSTTEQPLIDDASPKVYKWYTPPVTSNIPLDDVEYDDSIRHQYEYPDDYPEDQSYYDHSGAQPHSDHSGSQDLESHAREKDKNDKHNKPERRKFTKEAEIKVQISTEDKSHHKNKQHYKEDDTKHPVLRDNNYDTSESDKHYENPNSKDEAHFNSKDERDEQEVPKSRKIKETYQKVSKLNKEASLKDNSYNDHDHSVPTEEESQEYEKNDRIEDGYHLTPTSEEQNRENHNYHQQPQLAPEQESEINYHQNNKEEQNENYAVNKEQLDETQPQELRTVRNKEEKEFKSNSERKIIDLPQTKYTQIVNNGNNGNSHKKEESRYRNPNSKINQYKVIFNHPEINAQHKIPEERKSKHSLPQTKSKSMSFYHRYTAKVEQPTKTTVYRGEMPQDDHINRTPYSQTRSELKNLKNYHQEEHPQRKNSKEIVDEQRERQINHPQIYHQEESSREVSEDKDQEKPYDEKTEEINNQDISLRQHYIAPKQQIIPQRNMKIYIEQEPPQHRQIAKKIQPQIVYKHDHSSKDTQSYQQDVPPNKHSEEVVQEQEPSRHRQISKGIQPQIFYHRDRSKGTQYYHQDVTPNENSEEVVQEQNPPQYRQIPKEIQPQIFYQRDRSKDTQSYQQDVPPYKHSEEVVQEQEPPQYRQIPKEIQPQIFYQHDRSKDTQSYQQDVPSNKHSEEVVQEQEPPQHRQISKEMQPQIFYHHDRSKDTQSYQQNVPPNEHSEEVVQEQLTQFRPESSTENVHNQDKIAHYKIVSYKNLPEREYHTHNRDAAHNERDQIHVVSPRPHGIHNNQNSNQHYSVKQSKGYKNKKGANIYQLNKNVRENHPLIQQELILQQQNYQPEHQHNLQHNIRQEYIPDSELIHNQKKQVSKNTYTSHNRQQNNQQQQRQINYRQQITPERLQHTHQQPHPEILHNYDARYLQHYTPHNTHIHHHHQISPSEQPRIRIITRRQKRQTSRGLPLSSQFRALLNRLYTPLGSASNNQLNNFQNFIASSFPSSQSSEMSRNPTQHRPTNYSPQQYHPRYLNPYNSDAQMLYDRSPVYSNSPFEETPYYYQSPQRPPLSSRPNHFRYFDDNGEQLIQNIRNSPQRPAEEVPSPPQPTANSQQDDTSDKPAASIEQKEPQQSSNSRNKPPTYPPLPTINPQNFPELKDFPFFNPSYSYSQESNDSLKDTENSQFSYNRIPPSRYNVPDLGVYFDPYGEFGVTPLYEPSQTTSDDAKDSDSTESPAGNEQSKESEGKNKDSSRRRVPGRIKRPLNTLSNSPYEDKNKPDKSKEEISLFVTAPPQHSVSTYGQQPVHLFVTPPSFLTGHSRVPSVFGPEFFVPPLRPPLTTETTPKEVTDKHVTQEDISSEISSEVTTQIPHIEVTTSIQRQRPHRRRPQLTSRPTQGSRDTTKRPSTTKLPSRRPSASERGSARHSERGSPRPISEHSQLINHRGSTTRYPSKPSTRLPARERPKPATLPSVHPTQQTSSESETSDDGEPNPFRGSVPYGTRLRRPSPSRQTSSQLSHERAPASITKRVQQPSASDQSITIAKTEPKQRTRHIQSVERPHQPRRATNQFREPTPVSISLTTYQPSPKTELPSRNTFRYSNEEDTTSAHPSSEEKEEQKVRRPSVRRATYIHKNQNLKPESKPKLFRGRTRIYHPRRGYPEATTQSTTTTSEATTTQKATSSTTKVSPAIANAVETTTPQEVTAVETESTPKLRVYTSRHGGSLRNERVINRLKDKPRLFTFGRPRGGAADDTSFDDMNFATESSSESKLSIPT